LENQWFLFKHLGCIEIKTLSNDLQGAWIISWPSLELFVHTVVFSVGTEYAAVSWQGAELCAAAGTSVKDQSIILGDVQFLPEITLRASQPGSRHYIHVINR
jgi:hypothetical protein